MRIGYSFWGFLGTGVTDTPDGGPQPPHASHRRPASRRGHDIVFLQTDRDLPEAGDDSADRYTWDDGFPDIDVLFLEWRWPIPGRNTTAVRRARPHLRPAPAARAAQTTTRHDRGAHHRLGQGPHTAGRRPARARRPTSSSARPRCTQARARPPCCSPSPTPRWTPPTRCIWPAAPDTAAGLRRQPVRPRRRLRHLLRPGRRGHRHLVAGKWTRHGRWPHVRFIGRIPFDEVADSTAALATMLLLPDRYAASGQMTQRIFEAVLAGMPAADTLQASASASASPRPGSTSATATAAAHDHPAARHVGTDRARRADRRLPTRLDLFRLSRQLAVLDACWTPNLPEGVSVMTRPPPHWTDRTGSLARHGQDRDYRLRRLRQDLRGQPVRRAARAAADPPGRRYYDRDWNRCPGRVRRAAAPPRGRRRGG